MPETAAKPSKRPKKAAIPSGKGKVAKSPESAPKAIRGAPTTFTKHIADVICIRISEGESLRKILKDEGMPPQSVVYEWLLRHPDFADQYTRAREEQADTLADEIIAIADESPQTVEVRDRDGNVLDIKIDSGYVNYQRQRIDARKWTAMKLKPKKYGERVALAGDADSPIKVEAEVQAENLLNALLKNSELKKQADE